MATRASNNPKRKSAGDSDETNEMAMMTMGLLQNCDLPPPAKVFAAPSPALLSSPSPANDDVLGIMGADQADKLELLKALRLSQTRAREAEKKVAVLARERDCLRNALIRDSSRLFAYRQWVRLVELQLSKLQRQQQWRFCSGCRCKLNGFKGSSNEEGDGGEDVVGGGLTWFLGLVLCLGIAGVGFAFGFSCLF